MAAHTYTSLKDLLAQTPPVPKLTTPSSPFPNPPLQTNIENLSEKINLIINPDDDDRDEGKDDQRGCIYNKRSWEDHRGRLFPPPLPCLKFTKFGVPFVYFRFDESSRNFVREETRIPAKNQTFLLREEEEEEEEKKKEDEAVEEDEYEADDEKEVVEKIDE